MKDTKTELYFVYFLELYNVYFYEVLWNSESIRLWSILLKNVDHLCSQH